MSILANKYFIAGVFVGCLICMLIGYGLVKYDEWKEKKRNEKLEKEKQNK